MLAVQYVSYAIKKKFKISKKFKDSVVHV